MYELVFWKYIDEVYLNNQEVYEDILDKKQVEGLEEIPVLVIFNRIQNVFSNWKKVDEFSFKNNKGPGAFQIIYTNLSFIINCFGTEGKTMNQLCAILDEFKIPLYDPQIPVRYDEFNE